MAEVMEITVGAPLILVLCPGPMPPCTGDK